MKATIVVYSQIEDQLYTVEFGLDDFDFEYKAQTDVFALILPEKIWRKYKLPAHSLVVLGSL